MPDAAVPVPVSVDSLVTAKTQIITAVELAAQVLDSDADDEDAEEDEADVDYVCSDAEGCLDGELENDTEEMGNGGNEACLSSKVGRCRGGRGATMVGSPSGCW